MSIFEALEACRTIHQPQELNPDMLFYQKEPNEKYIR